MQAAQPRALLGLLGALIFMLIPALPARAEDHEPTPEHLTHELCPEQDCRSAVARFLEAFRSEDRNDLAALVDFPVYRGYPVVAPIEREEFGARFDDLFTDKLTRFIAASDPDDWQVDGWRGISLRGPSDTWVWLHHDGSLRGVYGGWPAEWQAEWNRLIELERGQLHVSLRAYERPILEWDTERHRVRIDSLGGGSFRYASWPAGVHHRRKPDLILLGGRVFGHGGCGNHQYDFPVGQYLYQVRVHRCAGSAGPGELFVYRSPGVSAAYSQGRPLPDDYELVRRERFTRTPSTLEELAIGARRRTEVERSAEPVD